MNFAERFFASAIIGAAAGTGVDFFSPETKAPIAGSFETGDVVALVTFLLFFLILPLKRKR